MCRLSKMEVCCIGVKGERRNLTLCMLNCDKNGDIGVNRCMLQRMAHFGVSTNGRNLKSVGVGMALYADICCTRDKSSVNSYWDLQVMVRVRDWIQVCLSHVLPLRQAVEF